MRWWLVSMTVFAVGCSKSGRSCGGKYLLLWPDAGMSYAPRVVEAHALPDAGVLSGPAARVYFEANPGSERGFSGKAAEPQTTIADGVCVPTDAGSAQAISAYVQFERLQAFDRRLGVAAQVSWPRDVGVETRLTGAPEATENNAHYVGTRDIVMLVPTTMPNVPVALNLGVLAHEHFHAHFQSQVLNALATIMPPISADQITPGLRPTTPSASELVRKANDYVMRGWNEGLADLYASVYLGSPDFLSASFGRNDIAAFRDLQGPPTPIGNDETLARVQASELNPAAAGTNTRFLGGLVYSQGTALSRAMWTMLHVDHANDMEATLASMMKSLAKLPARLIGTVNATEMDYGLVLSTLLENVSLSPRTCENLRAMMQSSDSYRRIVQCAP